MIEFYNIDFLKFEYLRPIKECWTNEHLKKEEVIEESKDYFERKLYYTKELFLNEIETEFLSKIEILWNSNLNLKMPKFWKIGDSLNLLYASNFNDEVFIDLIKFHWKFLNNWEGNNFSKTQNIINSGFIYQFGRDENLYPNIYIDFEKFFPKDDNEDYYLALNFLIKFVKTFMLLPDYVEKLNIIINLNNLSIFSFKFNILQDLLIYIDNYFSNIINKFYILNLGILLKVTYKGFTKLLIDRIYNKISILSNIKELLKEDFDKNQLEIKFGGNLENLKEFWPPYDTFKNFKKLEIYDLIKNNDDIFYFDNYHYEKVHNKKPNKTIKIHSSSKNFSNILNSFQYKNNDLQENRQTFKTNWKEDNKIFKKDNYDSILSYSNEEKEDSISEFKNPFFNNNDGESELNETIKEKKEKSINKNESKNNLNKEQEYNEDENNKFEKIEAEKISLKLNDRKILDQILEKSDDQSLKEIQKKKVKIFDSKIEKDKKRKNNIFWKKRKNYDEILDENEKLIQHLEKKYNVNQNNKGLYDKIKNIFT